MVQDFQSPDVNAYLDTLTDDRRHALETLRKMVLKAAPEAKESMRYGMPTFDYAGGFFAMASQKSYVSLYMDVGVVEKHRAELGKLECGKSCIRFKRLEQLPLEVIQAMMVEAVST